MSWLKTDQTTTHPVKSLLENCNFVGVGGLKWSTCTYELYGNFESKTKLRKYGNQWHLYDSKGIDCRYLITVNGSNDCDDFNGHVMDILHHEDTETFYDRVPRDYNTWLNSLKPHIKNYFLDIKSHAKNAKLGYVPVIPRYWLHKFAREFAHDLDFYILAILPSEIRTKIKKIPTPSLYYHEKQCDIPPGKHDTSLLLL